MRNIVVVTLSDSQDEDHPGRCVTGVYGPFTDKPLALQFVEDNIMDWEDPHYMTLQGPERFEAAEDEQVAEALKARTKR